MKTVGIVAEYNPFHHGHLYQIRELRAQTGADFVIAVMSGDFVQRGKPAIYNKYVRTRMALLAGVDLVLELPVCFVTGSAEDFAACGVTLLDRLGVVDVLGFGSEAGDCQGLFRAASVLEEEPEGYVCRLREGLRKGLSFPAARARALEDLFLSEETERKGMDGMKGGKDGGDWHTLLMTPNNILGIEYLKALIRRHSAISPVTIRRVGQGYHDTDRIRGERFASASAIRRAIREHDFDLVCEQMPEECWRLLSVSEGEKGDEDADENSDENEKENKKNGKRGRELAALTAVFSDDLSGLLNHRLLELAHQNPADPFGGFADMAPELGQRLRRHLLDFDSFSGRVMQLKTRGYTYTRISRALLHLLLGITAEQTARYREKDYVCYARILGFRRQAGPLLSALKRHSSLPLITKTADAGRFLDEDGLELLHMDFYASHLYQTVVFEKGGRCDGNEYTRSVIVV